MVQTGGPPDHQTELGTYVFNVGRILGLSSNKVANTLGKLNEMSISKLMGER